MAYKDPNDPRKTNAARLLKDNEYANTERGFVTLSISRRFLPSVVVRRGGHVVHESTDKKRILETVYESYYYYERKIFQSLMVDFVDIVKSLLHL